MDRKLFVCDCWSLEHQVVFEKIEGDEDIYINIHLSSLPFFDRLILGVKYIFGYKCKWGNWESMTFNPDKQKEMKKWLDTAN